MKIKDRNNPNEQELLIVREMCRIRSLVYNSIGDYTDPCDGFCDICPYAGTKYFRSTMSEVDYIRRAVVDRLKMDGYKIADGFDTKTGMEILPNAEDKIESISDSQADME